MTNWINKFDKFSSIYPKMIKNIKGVIEELRKDGWKIKKISATTYMVGDQIIDFLVLDEEDIEELIENE